MPDTTAIETRGLTKHYGSGRGRVRALEELNLNVDSGEILGLLGPNGAGKTTTMKLLTGLTQPTKGEFSLFGAPMADRSQLGRVGFLSEERCYCRGLKLGQALMFYASLYGHSKQESRKRVKRAAKMVGLREKLNARPRSLSKGWMQRFGLAQALLNDPELLILDEPTSGLDVDGQEALRGFLHDLKNQGRTIVFSSHRLDEVERICDRVAFIKQGRLLDIVETRQATSHGMYVLAQFSERTKMELVESLDDVENAYLTSDGKTWRLDLKDGCGASGIIKFLSVVQGKLIDVKRDEISLEEVFRRTLGEDADEEDWS